MEPLAGERGDALDRGSEKAGGRFGVSVERESAVEDGGVLVSSLYKAAYRAMGASLIPRASARVAHRWGGVQGR